jgi:hypothetical protein
VPATAAADARAFSRSLHFSCSAIVADTPGLPASCRRLFDTPTLNTVRGVETVFLIVLETVFVVVEVVELDRWIQG